MQFNTITNGIKVDNIFLDNVCEFCYLGHTIFNNNSNSTTLRISKATSKFCELSHVLKDQEVHLSIRKKLLIASVLPRLTYATQSWRPSEEEIKRLEACWCGFLRSMVKGGFRRKPAVDGSDINFSLVYTNNDIYRISKCHPIRNSINTQYLKYIAHACRRTNNNLTKLSLFIIPKSRYYRDPWIKVSELLGGISIQQAKRETQSKAGFFRLLQLKFIPEEL